MVCTVQCGCQQSLPPDRSVHHLHDGKFLKEWIPRQFLESDMFSDRQQQADYLQPRYPPISGQEAPVTHTAPLICEGAHANRLQGKRLEP